MEPRLTGCVTDRTALQTSLRHKLTSVGITATLTWLLQANDLQTAISKGMTDPARAVSLLFSES